MLCQEARPSSSWVGAPPQVFLFPSTCKEPRARAGLGLRESGGLAAQGREAAFIGSPGPQGSLPCDRGGDQGGDICTKV